MANTAEVVLRHTFCRAQGCGGIFYICRSCDRGQRYCTDRCRSKARHEQRRAANRRHQQTPEGRLDHRDRQRAYRQRRAQARVTDQSSRRLHCAGSIRIRAVAEPVAANDDETSHQIRAAFCAGPLCCIVCGRVGRFVNPFFG